MLADAVGPTGSVIGVKRSTDAVGGLRSSLPITVWRRSLCTTVMAQNGSAA
jgi:hypothetical protein